MPDEWISVENGKTVGQSGSEQGTIVRDDEHALGARITLERDGSIAPWAITCGIYGSLMHTRFFSGEEEATAQYDEMKMAIAGILDDARRSNFEDDRALADAVGEFVEKYPT